MSLTKPRIFTGTEAPGSLRPSSMRLPDPDTIGSEAPVDPGFIGRRRAGTPSTPPSYPNTADARGLRLVRGPALRRARRPSPRTTATPGHLLDRGSLLGGDAGADDRVPRLLRQHDEVALLCPKRSGAAVVETVEQAAEEEQEEHEQRQHPGCDHETPGPPSELAERDPHVRPPSTGFADCVGRVDAQHAADRDERSRQRETEHDEPTRWR